MCNYTASQMEGIYGRITGADPVVRNHTQKAGIGSGDKMGNMVHRLGTNDDNPRTSSTTRTIKFVASLLIVVGLIILCVYACIKKVDD